MTTAKRHVAILGSTGSIGTQAIEIVRSHPDRFQVDLLTAHTNADLLIQQAILTRPKAVVIGQAALHDIVKTALEPLSIKVYSGSEAIEALVQMESIDIVLTAMVGAAGLMPTVRAIEAGKTIALANKETLVVAGALIMQLAQQKNVAIYPVDSEHSAIFQCLMGENPQAVEKIILTASGGPFRGKSREFLASVTKEQALKHPNWSMGAKITIDSATLMNKGLEVIEARWLFDLSPDQIDVIVHSQSIVHSLVQFKDGSLKAQMGLPDMRVPIQLALSYPNRLQYTDSRFDFLDYPFLTFEKPDLETFRNLQLAFDALHRGGNAPCILNAANEIAVDAFLHDKIRFLDIPDIIELCLARITFHPMPELSDYLAVDAETRMLAKNLLP